MKLIDLEVNEHDWNKVKDEATSYRENHIMANPLRAWFHSIDILLSKKGYEIVKKEENNDTSKKVS
jgi:hypothetical protein